jgi:hypothetical protein
MEKTLKKFENITMIIEIWDNAKNRDQTFEILEKS